MRPLAFFSVDWGTSAFRLRLVDADSLAVRAERSTEEGTAALARARSGAPAGGSSAFPDTLARRIREIENRAEVPEDAPVAISGMTSSSIGWKEKPCRWKRLRTFFPG